MANFRCDYCNAIFKRKPSQIRGRGKYCSRQCQIEVRKLDITGERFGRLVVIAPSTNKNGHRYWLCKCDCGNERLIGSSNLHNCTRSCGCLSSEVISRRNIANKKHGHCKKENGRVILSPTYNSWRSMLTRCEYPKHPHYAAYGGCGIKVCERWRGDHGFTNFLADMGKRPEGLTLDRYPDPYGNYEPSNCRWATWSEQNKNKRRKVEAVKALNT